MQHYLDFEKELAILDGKVSELRSVNSSKNEEKEKNESIKEIKKKSNLLLKKIYSDLSPWHKCQIARHPERPHSSIYIEKLMTEFIPLAGDKKFAEDYAVIGGIAKIENKSVVVIGTEKGNSMESRIKHNFGMAKPEGYRKAQRLMNIADKYNLPIITFVDTAGAFPGKDAEERGQSESIASSIQTSLKIGSPIISIVIGEGGSGGAIALATADKVLMLEHSIYSVISPEGCASILWRSSDYIQKAAESLKLTAKDCLNNKIIDSIVKEVSGGAHRFPEDQADILKNEIRNSIEALKLLSIEERKNQRNQKFLNMTAEI